MMQSLRSFDVHLRTAAVILALVTPFTAAQNDRMAWWREARFGLFIHWGLYAIPAGEWKGETHHGEWIMNTAKIPVGAYEKFLARFNPGGFDADRWVRTAKAAGMRYIVITSKHHDGFALFDSKAGDYDVMATPFQRDILKELSAACHKHGLRLGFYHSIMDWHHSDYLPRRRWEKRSSKRADYDRYVRFLKTQVGELLTRYGDVGVMWFDGEWESTWTHAHGQDLYAFCRKIRPQVVINNRVDKGRQGMAGLTAPGFCGDFGTPEQEIPAKGLPGVDWETCMTMNRHWGYNKHDNRWKSAEDLIRKLIDIASKGGNFLLNVGPTAEGRFPPPSVERLLAMGKWMKINGDAIYGTAASPFGRFDWGRCTMKVSNAPEKSPHHLFLHVFKRPESGILRLPGLLEMPETARLLAQPTRALDTARDQHDVVITLPKRLPDPVATVVALGFKREPRVVGSPQLDVGHGLADSSLFVDETVLRVRPPSIEGLQARYTLDGTDPTPASSSAAEGIPASQTVLVTVRFFRGDRPVSAVSRRTFRKVTPRPSATPGPTEPGCLVQTYRGRWKKLPDWSALVPDVEGPAKAVSLEVRPRNEHFGLQFTGFVQVPEDGIYRFTLRSDDGAALYVGDEAVINNDGLHGLVEKSGEIALAAGLHPTRVDYFNGPGDRHLGVWIEGPGLRKQGLGPNVLRRPAISVVPRPARCEPKVGWFEITPDTRIVVGPGGESEGQQLARALRRSTGFAIPVRPFAPPAGPAPAIVIEKKLDADLPPEGYRLCVQPGRVTAVARTDAGLFYAGVSLRQLLPPLIESPTPVESVAWTAPACLIEDRPRFTWRGLMIDSCRHFQPKNRILKLLDWMALHKLNRFHWHLTEDEAWRIEIKRFPELTRVGAWRGDGVYRYGGYYSQPDVREVVAHAKRLHITVVPEIEMPGHCMAALVAKPALTCDGKPIPVGDGGLRHFTARVRRLPFCAGKEETFAFLQAVLAEVMDLFPSTWVHIGGDERPRGAWKRCALCQKRIRDSSLVDEDGLQSYFVRRIERFLSAHNRRLIGWDEILEGGLAPRATVMSWRGTSGGIQAARAGHDVIMCPTSHCYFDYWQGDPGVEPVGRGHRITPEVVYSFEPVPDALSDKEARHILGAQANVWTEYLIDPDLVEYMTFPRITALAEVVWTPKEKRSWESFKSRLHHHFARLSALGVKFRIPPPGGLRPENLFVEGTKLELVNPVPGATIRWTRDRRVPNPDSPRYVGPIEINQGQVVGARLFLPDGRASRPVTGRFRRAEWIAAVDPGPVRPGLDLAYHEGAFRRTADVLASRTVRRGTQSSVALPEGRREDQHGCVLNGYLCVQEDGIYTFGLNSDDGSRLFVGNALIVDNDGTHRARERTGQAALRAGYHPIRVIYFDRGGPEKLAATIAGPGLETQSLPPAMLFRRRRPRSQ